MRGLRSVYFILIPLAISVAVLAAVKFWPTVPRQPVLDNELWQQFQAKFVQNGRVIDRDNGDISHSEGQGYGMIIAEASDDRQIFDELFEWTQNHLLRDDGLLAWRWEEGRGITDRNNATDGDILVAWALVRAAKRWNEPKYIQEALGFMEAVRSHAITEVAGRPFILPGVNGFDKLEGPILNPSYWVYPALDDFAALENDQFWFEVAEAGVWLTEQSAVPPYGLVPDWAQLTDHGAKPAPDFHSRFSWDAIRVPLYIAWGTEERQELLKPYQAYWKNSSSNGEIPAWIDLKTGETATYAAPIGIRALAQLITGSPSFADLGKFEIDDSYYSSTLLLLTKIAELEGKAVEAE